MILETMPFLLAICRLESTAAIPAWASQSEFFSITRTAEELSIVCAENVAPQNVKAERQWRCLKVRGPLDFGLTGILSSLTEPLAKAGISIFALSTFDTDYLLVKQSDFENATAALGRAGHDVVDQR